MIGDVVQLANTSGQFYHTLLITEITDNEIFVSAHTNDALDRPLSDYSYASLRVLHIEGAMLELDTLPAYDALFNGTALAPINQREESEG